MTARRSEKAIQNDTLVELSALEGGMFWRNNTGQGWVGKRVEARVGSTIKVTQDMVILTAARPITFGLPGSADILGAYRGVPCAVEIKAANGRQSQQQKAFETVWTRAGGLYVLARSPAEAVDGLSHFSGNLTEFGV